MSFIQANPGQDQEIIDRVNAKILINNKVWAFLQPPRVNFAQNVYINYFGMTCTWICGYLVYIHSPRLQYFVQHKPSRFIAPLMAITYAGSHYANDRFSRRRLQAMDRYDRDWRNMPTFVPKPE